MNPLAALRSLFSRRNPYAIPEPRPPDPTPFAGLAHESEATLDADGLPDATEEIAGMEAAYRYWATSTSEGRASVRESDERTEREEKARAHMKRATREAWILETIATPTPFPTNEEK